MTYVSKLDNIIELLEEPNTPLKRELIDQEIDLLKKATGVCAQESERVLNYFREWRDYTERLSLAVKNEESMFNCGLTPEALLGGDLISLTN